MLEFPVEGVNLRKSAVFCSLCHLSSVPLSAPREFNELPWNILPVTVQEQGRRAATNVQNGFVLVCLFSFQSLFILFKFSYIKNLVCSLFPLG